MDMQEKGLKDVELGLISELLKNSRRSDRELAKAIGVSQPTVSRTLAKLKKEGFIRNFTIIPDFGKLGYSILAITFVKLKESYPGEEREKVRKAVKDRVEQSQFGIVMLERGIGLGYDGCIISIYRDYSEYSRHKDVIRAFPFIDTLKTETFIINLEDDVRYRPLNFDALARQLAARGKSKSKA
jgi:DNA-binding Lrp family transcriptional regulator